MDTLDICGRRFFWEANLIIHLKTVYRNSDGYAAGQTPKLTTTTGEQIETTIART